MKSEPDVYSISDLERNTTTTWEGVRNYQARNFMRDDMKIGDLVLYYHSNTAVPGIVGLARVCKESYPDFTAFDKKSNYFDPKSDPENPRWMMVDVEYLCTFDEVVSLQALKEEKSLSEMKVVQRGQRLSVQPVTLKEFKQVCKMAGVNIPS